MEWSVLCTTEENVLNSCSLKRGSHVIRRRRRPGKKANLTISALPCRFPPSTPHLCSKRQSGLPVRQESFFFNCMIPTPSIVASDIDLPWLEQKTDGDEKPCENTFAKVKESKWKDWFGCVPDKTLTSWLKMNFYNYVHVHRLYITSPEGGLWRAVGVLNEDSKKLDT